ncbi:MAG: cytochrome P450 [Acidimicrobiales bacterium]
MAASVPGRPTRVDEVDFFCPATQEDWYPTYDLLRAEAPVWQMPGTTTYVLTRYDDIADVLRRIDVFGRGAGESTPSAGPNALTREIYERDGWPRRSVLGSNPPEHADYRRIVDPFFTVAAAERRRDLIQGIIDELLGSFEPDGTCEFVRQFAIPLPVRVITAFMGFRAEDIPQLKVWSEAWVLPFKGRLSDDEAVYAGEKGVEFQHFIADTMRDKRATPDDSVISYLVNEARFRDRPLTEAEIINMVDHLYIGGNETTTFALTSGMWLLLSNPDTLAALRADRSRTRVFVEEVLRAESPTMGMVRTALIDTDVGGVPIPRGASLHLRYAAANRDPAVFGCPAEFDHQRPNAHRHLAFSWGETVCPGAGLSRVEQRLTFETLVPRLANLRLSPGRNDFSHHPNVTLRAMKELWLDWDPPSPPAACEK